MQADVAAALSLKPDVIISGGTPITAELRQRTHTIPIIFVNVGDPIATGLVHSLAQPEGNLTGFTAWGEKSIGGKWVELLKEIAPQVKKILLLVDPQNPTRKFHVPTIEAAASSFALSVTAVQVRTPRRDRECYRRIYESAECRHDRAAEPICSGAS
jgi:ABC-type uncharacterized transport system substrate-binding protein